MHLWKSIVGVIIAFLIGVIPAFFINLNLVFSDRSGTLNEWLLIVLLITVTYGILGLVFGFVAHSRPITWSLALTIPAVLLLSIYILKEPQVIAQSMISLCLTLITSWIGAFVGLNLRQKFKKE